MRREGKYSDQKCLNITSLQTYYLNLDNSVSGSSRHIERAHSVQTKCTFCGLNNHSAEKCFKRIRQEKENSRAVGISSNRTSDHPPRKCFRCGSEGHMIAKCPKPPKDSEKRRKSERSKGKSNCACDNSYDDNDHKIYEYMAQMSSDDIDAYNLWSLSPSLLSHARLPFSLERTDLRCFSLSLGGLGNFAII